MISDHMLPFANHVWQSTLFVIAVWIVSLALRKNRAAVRHCLWVAASVKFLVPFSILVGIGTYFQSQTSSATPPLAVSMIVRTISQPFSTGSSGPNPALQSGRLAAVFIGVWICGVAASFCWWLIRWWQVRRVVRLGTPANFGGPLRVAYGPDRFEPGVFGILRPVLVLPEGVTQRLSPAQLDAVLAHEFCHVRRWDNLTMAIHMIVEALFWFHPLVWWIKARLVDEQERACDEEVLRLGGDRQVYAESILKICEFYLTAPSVCVSGIAGSNLKKRIEDIMRNRVALKLSWGRSLLLVAAAMAALAGPVLSGFTSLEAGVAPVQRSQVQLPTAAPQEYRIGEIRVTGAKVLKNEFVLSTLGVASGETFNESRIGNGFKELARQYGILGYVNFVPTPSFDFDEQRKIVNLTVSLDEGLQYKVNRISFTGNTTIPDEVIRRELQVKEGVVLNASLLDVSLARLNRLGVFEEIKIEDFRVSPASSQPVVDIELRVKEKRQ
jgi:beta-lactamase regulating signal transducer with metallopeptidase domain